MSTASVDGLPSYSKAAVLTKYLEPLELQELPLPNELAPEALLVRMEASTVCGSDHKLWAGRMGGALPLRLPLIPGHEFAGRIVRFGPGDRVDSFGTPLRLGDRITFVHSNCGHCDYCSLHHLPALCTNRDMYTFTSSEIPPHLFGGFSEYVHVFPRSGRVRVPDTVDSAIASASSCALRTVVHSFERLGTVEPWQTLVIQGSGPLGLFATAMADHLGAGRIIVIGGPADRLALARRYGATDTIAIADHAEGDARVEAVLELTGGKGADAIIELSGARTAFTEGLRMMRVAGRYIITGPMDEPGTEVEIRPGYLTGKQVNIMGAWSADISHYWKALRFLEKTADKYDFAAMTTARYPLTEATTALERMGAYADIKPVVIP
ncbi:zinc-binding dehydrogenase [Saccharopolyspora spinosa]|uniref:Threonine dehydrogenase-like Zn-dependent dehydrogenase n=1 Tax=Saccharopolyspora spinosa TaxID=60894 RepID=A0A2N3Y1F7_SACSN|nr:zinc-binding dehydrogenase [Saccharopolyspora spinosa]PKW16774.1 threonine dehydrogenase-like Zn-dependent dehydrogenase [Saccharopolyspora spinosa]